MVVTAKPKPLAVVALAYVCSAILYPWLPDHTFSPRFTALVLPTTCAIVYLLLESLGSAAASRSPAHAGAHDAIVLRILVVIAALHAIVLVGLLDFARTAGPTVWVARGTGVLLGAGLLMIGNLLPRTRPNPALGIRTSATLNDKDAWMRVNRMAGYVAVTLGAALIAIALFVPLGTPWGASFGAAGIAALAALIVITRRRADV